MDRHHPHGHTRIDVTSLVSTSQRGLACNLWLAGIGWTIGESTFGLGHGESFVQRTLLAHVGVNHRSHTSKPLTELVLLLDREFLDRRTCTIRLEPACLHFFCNEPFPQGLIHPIVERKSHTCSAVDCSSTLFEDGKVLRHGVFDSLTQRSLECFFNGFTVLQIFTLGEVHFQELLHRSVLRNTHVSKKNIELANQCHSIKRLTWLEARFSEGFDLLVD